MCVCERVRAGQRHFWPAFILLKVWLPRIRHDGRYKVCFILKEFIVLFFLKKSDEKRCWSSGMLLKLWLIPTFSLRLRFYFWPGKNDSNPYPAGGRAWLVRRSLPCSSSPTQSLTTCSQDTLNLPLPRLPQPTAPRMVLTRFFTPHRITLPNHLARCSLFCPWNVPSWLMSCCNLFYSCSSGRTPFKYWSIPIFATCILCSWPFTVQHSDLWPIEHCWSSHCPIKLRFF